MSEPRMRRRDGICPECRTRPRRKGRGYCTRCETMKRSQRANRRRAAIPGWPRIHGIPRPSKLRRTALSGRELAILTLMCEGEPIKEIARSLELSIPTVKMARMRMLLITGLRSITQLCYWAGRTGVVTVEIQQQSGSRPRAISQAGLITHSDPAAAGEGAGL